MEFVTISLEAAKEALKEAAKEASKAALEGAKKVAEVAETRPDFGKLGNPLESEHVTLGKINVEHSEAPVRFGSEKEEFFCSDITLNRLTNDVSNNLTNTVKEVNTPRHYAVRKIDKAVEIEATSFGKADGGSQISFGSLANGEFKHNENYLKWKDGIDFGEVNKAWIEELTNEISAIYGNDKISVSKRYGYNNAGINTYLGRLIYDPNYLREAGNEYGMDTILGTLSHEVGHRVVHNIGLESEITPYENEACADYIAGLTARLCKLDSTHRLAWYNGGPEVTPNDVHPGKSVRMEAFTRGLTRIDTGKEATMLKTFEAFSPYDLEGVYQNSEMLKSILYQDVIAPLRTGEIKKV